MPPRTPRFRPAGSTVNRPCAAKRGYGHHWKIIRAQKLAANPWCEYCEERIAAVGRTGSEGPSLACDVDHRDGNVNNVAWSNLKSACRKCHNKKSHGRRKQKQ